LLVAELVEPANDRGEVDPSRRVVDVKLAIPGLLLTKLNVIHVLGLAAAP
jgi:hypothetical protein